MAKVGSDGDVHVSVVNERSGTGIKDTEKDIKSLSKASKSTSEKLEDQWRRLESAQKRLGLTTSREKMEMVQAYKSLKSSGVASMDELRRAKKRLDETLRGEPGLIQKLQQDWLKLAAVGYTFMKAWDVAEMAAQFDQTDQAFTNIVGSMGGNSKILLGQLKSASAGTINELELMKNASTAILLGIEAEALPKMMAIARASSRGTGQTIQKSFDDIVKGVGRQSKLILDNLGITVDMAKANKEYAKAMNIVGRELTETEKKQAFMNATMKAGDEIIRQVGVRGLTASEAMQKFKATMQNISVIAGKVVITLSTVVGSLFTGLSAAVNGVLAMVVTALQKIVGLFGGLPGVGKFIKPVEDALKGFAENSKLAAKEAGDMTKAQLDVGAAIWKQKEPINGLITARQEMMKQDQKVKELNEKLASDIKAVNEEYLKLTVTNREYLNIKAAEMEAQGADIVLIEQWLSAHRKLLDQKEKERQLNEINKILDEKGPETLQAEAPGMDGLNAEQARMALQMEAIDNFHNDKMARLADAGATEEQMLQAFADRQVAIEDQKEQAKVALQRKAFGMAANLFGNLASLGGKHAKQMFEAQKIANISQAAVDGYSSIQSAYKWGNTVGGPIVGGIFAGLAAAFTAANMAKIKGQKFGGGGSVSSGGGGGSASYSVPSSSYTIPESVEREVAEPEKVKKIYYVNVHGDVFDVDGTARVLKQAIAEAEADGV